MFIEIASAFISRHGVLLVGSVTQVTIACDAVLSSKSPYRKQDPDTWENELPVSKYANNLVQLDNGVRIPPR